MKLAPYLLTLTKLPLSVEACNAGKANLSMILTGLLLLLFSDGLSISSAGYLDLSEFIALNGGFLFDCLAASLFSLLLTNPIVIEQLWRLIRYIIKLINKLSLAVLFPGFSIPQFQAQVQTAHGCRAPPLSTRHF
ncbi:hypothetical protein [Shewanella kaireitica]|uniref:hypothetical protein n=1 Tax=Shewanella kaireitica TaxID=212021 RepID=UPI00200C194C|nr:hypothetical protein [Shewanella kaireitica]MCL1093648.1 hypothetical protein [Shewanella kaireitica]